MSFLLALLLTVQADDLDSLKKKFEADKSKTYSLRYSTVSKIGSLKTDEAAEFLIEIYQTDADLNVRSYALTSLGTCATPKAIAKLKEILDDDTQEYRYQSSALSALSRTKSEEALKMIMKIVDDVGNRLRTTAYSSLRNFPLKKTEKIWRKALRDTSFSIQSQAFRALAELKDKEVLDEARKVLEDATASTFLKQAAVEPWKVAGGVEAVKVFLLVADTTDSRLRKAIIDFFAKLKKEEEVAALLKGMNSRDENVRAMVARALGKLSHPDADRVLVKAAKDKSVDVRIAALESLAERKGPDAEDIIRKEAQKGKDAAALAAIGLLAGFPNEATLDLLKKLARAKKLEIKVSALDAMGEMGTAEVIPIFKKALRSRDWPVRAACVRALGKIKDKESIDILIEQFRREDGRLKADIATSLKKLTGKSLGYEMGHWRDWWKVNREKFKFPDKVEGVDGGVAGSTTYYGVPVLSKKMIFCLDISGSMSATSGSSTRLEQAKKALSGTLKKLPKGTFVNMIFFDTVIEPWKKQLVNLAANLGPALKAVGDLSPRGGTNIFDTLETAFQDKNVDTIYLLSDGAPGSGKFVNTEDILREIKKMNRSRQIVIHTISLGKSDFMKKLAEQNGGQYVEAK